MTDKERPMTQEELERVSELLTILEDSIVKLSSDIKELGFEIEGLKVMSHQSIS